MPEFDLVAYYLADTLIFSRQHPDLILFKINNERIT